MRTALALSSSDPRPGPARRTLRLMIVDDSIVARAVLSRMLEAAGGIEIVAAAATAEEAIAKLREVSVDIVLLDLHMPGAGGLNSIPAILEVARGARVMIVSSNAEDGAADAVAALALGAADTLPKPGAGRFNGRFAEVLVARLRELGEATVAATVTETHGPRLRAMSAKPLRLLALGASTGGVAAFAEFFAHLPPGIGVPILVTQHLPAPFMPVFARQLAAAADRPALVAEDGMRIEPDVIYVAPGDAHLTVDGEHDGMTLKLVWFAASSGCLPSVDPMFASIGRLLGEHGLGVVLTGMGRDGFEGAARLVACGGAVLAQDRASSAVWGMPGAIAEGGLAAAVLPPRALARRVALRCGVSAWN